MQFVFCWKPCPISYDGRMNRFFAIFVLILAGCAKPDAKYSDLRPPTHATISGNKVTIHIGSDLANSAFYARPKARVDGQTVYVVGYHTMSEQSREFVVRLPASVGTQTVSVVWIDPDGSQIPVPVTK